jgi:hypothetical protein
MNCSTVVADAAGGLALWRLTKRFSDCLAATVSVSPCTRPGRWVSPASSWRVQEDQATPRVCVRVGTTASGRSTQGSDGVLTNRPAARSQRFIGSADSRRRGLSRRCARAEDGWSVASIVARDSVSNRAEVGESMAGPRASLSFTVGRRRQRARSVIPRPDGRGMRNDIDGMLHACRLPSDGRRTACHRGVSGRTRQRQYGPL